MKTPFYDKKGNLIFPYKPLRDTVFIYPTPPPESLGKDNLISIPEEFREYHQDKTGVVLAIGPGYYDKRNKWHPTDSRLKPDVQVYFDNTVPWYIYALGTDGKSYKVVICVECDVQGIVE